MTRTNTTLTNNSQATALENRALIEDDNEIIVERDFDDEAEMLDNEDAGEIPRRRERPRQQSRSNQRQFERQLDTIRGQAIEAGIAAADIDDALDGVRTVEEGRSQLFDLLAERSASIRTSPARERRNDRGGADRSRQDVTDYFALRIGRKPRDGDERLERYHPVEAIRRYLEENGMSTRSLSDHEVADMATSPTRYAMRGFHNASDFPLIFGDAISQVLVERFTELESPLKRFSRLRNARNLRPQSFIRPGEAPLLEKMIDNGEIKHGTLSEEAEGFQVDTYARMFGLSRKSIINDLLGGVSDMTMAFAESASQTEANLFYSLLSANSGVGVKLSDGKAWFHADHNNLAASGGALSVATINSGRVAMRTQKNVNGTGFAGAVPSVLLVGPALETTAEQMVATLNAAAISDVNPFAGKLRVEVENRYGGNGWWLFADPKSRPAFMHGYLDGLEGPQVETRDGWNILGTEVRCVLDFGCGIYDWRAAYFNPGE